LAFTFESKEKLIQAQIETLLATLELTPLREESLARRREAASRAFNAAEASLFKTRSAAWAQFASALVQVQQAQGELLAAVVELDQIQLRAQSAIASADLERDLTEKQADVRTGLQRQVRSYDR